MTTKPRLLVLVERGATLPHRQDLVTELEKAQSTLVLAESSGDLDRLRYLSVETGSIDAHIPLSQAIDGALYSEARTLVKQWSLSPRLSQIARDLDYHGLPLWDFGELYYIDVAFKLLKTLRRLEEALTAQKWDRLIVFVNSQTLSAPLQVVLSGSGFTGEVAEIQAQPTVEPSILGRLYVRLGFYWLDQVMHDVRGGLRLPKPQTLGRLCSPRGSRPFLFLLNSNSLYLHTLLPVMSKVASSDRVLALNTGDVIPRADLQGHDIRLSYCAQFVPLLAWSRIEREARRVKLMWKTLECDDRFNGLFEHKGTPLWACLRSDFQYRFLRLLPRMMVWAEAFQNIFATVRPRALATVPDGHVPARVAVAVAKQYGVPSLTVQPALISDHPQYGDAYADRICVIDEFSRRVFLNRGGVAAERVTVTGLPRWDGISAVSRESARRASRDRLNLDSEARLVVFATENLALPLTTRMLQAVLQATSAHPDILLVIKVHPSESVERYEKLLGTLQWTGLKPLVVRDIELHPLLAACEVLIGWYSNVLLEGVILDRPVLVVNLSGERDPLPFVENGIALGAYTPEEVRKQLHRLLDDPQGIQELGRRRHSYLQLQPQLGDGQSSERVAALLRRMAVEAERESGLQRRRRETCKPESRQHATKGGAHGD